LNNWKFEYPSPDIRGPMPQNAHPDSTFSSHLHNDWTYVSHHDNEYPSPDIRGPIPENAHPDVTFSPHLHNDWTHVQLADDEVTGREFEGQYIPPDKRLFDFEDEGDY
jgi:hypothetical protein